MTKALIFDWGDTVMRDFPDKPGPMAYWDIVELIPGVEDALKDLSRNYLCCIATSAGASDTKLMIKALKRVGVDKYFRYFFSAKDIGYNKPDPRFFNTIAEKINTLPVNCVMIGNSYEKDIVGAKAIGMTTVLFYEQNLKHDFSDADYIINSMSDLFDTISKLK